MGAISTHYSLADATRSETASRQGIDNSISDAAVLAAVQRVARGILDPICDEHGRAGVSSFYRCEQLDAAIRGEKIYSLWKSGNWSSGSQHVRGEAVDFEVHGVANRDLAEWVRVNLVFDQLILEYPDADDPAAGWVHASRRAAGNRRVCLVKEKGKPYCAVERYL